MHLASINSAEEQDNLEDHIQSFGERWTERMLFGFNDEYSGGWGLFKSFAFWFRLGIFPPFDSLDLGSPRAPSPARFIFVATKSIETMGRLGAGRRKFIQSGWQYLIPDT